MQIILGGLVLILVLIICIFIYCCLIVSGRCSDIEEEMFNEYINRKDEVV